MELALSIISCVAALTALVAFFRRDIMMLQQNSYFNNRYAHWLNESHDSTTYIRLFAWCAFFVSLVSFWGLAVVAIFGIWAAWHLFTAKYKKPLVVTARVRRILAASILLALVIAFLAEAFFLPVAAKHILQIAAISFTFAMCVSASLVMCANMLLKPVERSINKKYYNEAASMLASMPALTVIGITGSYGKTSTKHYLHRILSEKYEVLMTPGNFNTTLGVVRTVREHMKPYHQIFIAEMGAKQPGDIKEICQLVHPTIGIITAVGRMHMDTFKTIENVRNTKFELADSLPASGLAVINNDFEPSATREVTNAQCIRYTANGAPNCDLSAANIAYTSRGTTFDIVDAKGSIVISLRTKLVGECNISNLVAAVAVAIHLGVDAEQIKYAVEQIEQVEHRLNMRHVPGGVNVIDDAYNSNPVGSKMALEVLGAIPSGTKFVITPGMIELGDDQYELNRRLGEEIAKHADVAFVVGQYNSEALLEGIRLGGMLPEKVHTADSFIHAHQAMMAMAKPGDTVLYENDLPDTFK